MGWLRENRALRRDAVTALVFAVCWFAGIWFARHHSWYPRAVETYDVCGYYTVGVLLTREIWPRLTLLIVCVSYPVLYGSYLSTEFHLLPILLAAYTVAAKGRLRSIWTLLLAELSVTLVFIPMASLVTLIMQRDGFWQWNLSRVIVAQVVTAAVVLLGRAAYLQQRATNELRHRHEELERLRLIETDQVVSAERTRIARELHDVVAHHISAVVIRAQAADRVADSRPEETREAVRWIAANGQETLAAMRHVVRVLRSTEVGGSLTPQATLADLPQIADRMSAVGLPVELRLPTVVPALPAAVELATVRIVQEALTNVLVHAGASRAMVELEFGPQEQIRLAIHDDGSAESSPTVPVSLSVKPPIRRPAKVGLSAARAGSGAATGRALGGNGLVGMRERAASCGGVLTIGTSPMGGWLVTAVLSPTLIGLTP